jgi:DNA-binding transcriptional ArsR family regulator
MEAFLDGWGLIAAVERAEFPHGCPATVVRGSLSSFKILELLKRVPCLGLRVDEWWNLLSRNFDKLAVKIFKALGDSNRYSIIKLLIEEGELSCADFDGRLKLSKPAMSHHYRILENAGLIEVRKEGLHFFMKANLDVLERFVPHFTETHTKR